MSDGTTGLADQAQRSASDVSQQTKEAAATVLETTKTETQAVAADARQHAQAVVGETRDQLRLHAGDQMDRLAGTLHEIGSQLDGMARGEAAPNGMVTDVTRQLASHVGSMAERIQGGGIDGVVEDLKRSARRRPGMFLLGALGAGMVAGRLIRAVDQGAITQAAKGGTEDSEPSGGDAEMAPTPPAAISFGSPTPVGMETASPGPGTGSPLGLEA